MGVFLARCVAVLVLLAPVAAAQPIDRDAETVAGTSLTDLLREHGELTTFVELLEPLGYLALLDQEGVYTLFVPSDAAFEALADEQLAALQGVPGAIQALVENHMVFGSVGTEALAGLGSVTTLVGTRMLVVGEEQQLLIGGAQLIGEGLEAENGIIYVIDMVLVPEDAFPEGPTYDYRQPDGGGAGPVTPGEGPGGPSPGGGEGSPGGGGGQ